MTFIDGSTKRAAINGAPSICFGIKTMVTYTFRTLITNGYFAKYETNDDGTGKVVSTGVLASSEAEVPIKESNIKNLKNRSIHFNESLLTHRLQTLKI
ncbi:hypothetical protein O9992_30675 [Vibrio lentus]|nr:hypothetical protein [Vibrio lentus]